MASYTIKSGGMRIIKVHNNLVSNNKSQNILYCLRVNAMTGIPKSMCASACKALHCSEAHIKYFKINLIIKKDTVQYCIPWKMS